MSFFDFLRRKPQKEPEMVRHAAALLLSLPAPIGSSLLNGMNRDEIELLGNRMNRLQTSAESLQDQAIHQFWGILVEHGKLSPKSQPNIQTIQQFVVSNPNEALTILRRYWLSYEPKITPVFNEEEKNDNSKFYHFPQKLIKKLFEMMSDEDMGTVAEELFQTFKSSRSGKIAPQEYSEMGQSIRDFLQLIPGSYQITERTDFEIQEKVAILISLLKPKYSSVIACKLLNRLNRVKLESLILAFLQIQEISEKGKTDVLRDFISFFNASFVTSTFEDEAALLEEIERMAGSMPGQIARCLHNRWLVDKLPETEWEELSRKNPELASQKLAEYFNQNKPGLSRHLTNFQKAAIFLQTIDPKLKKKVLERMHPGETDFLLSQMKRAGGVSADEKRRILQEFLGDYYFLSTTKLLENQEL